MTVGSDQNRYSSHLAFRHQFGRLFEILCLLSTWFGLVVLAVLLLGVSFQAAGWLDWQFLTSPDSYKSEKAGVFAGLLGSIWLILFTAIFTIPVGIGAAVYLEEYSNDNLLTQTIRVNLSNLAGVPSIVYGILGLAVFVRMFGIFPTNAGEALYVWPIPLGIMTLAIPIPFGRSLLAGSLTLSLLILPVVIIASQEALRSIPPTIRHASLALGATRWQTIRHQVLPAAMPGIATGVILALSRAMGETAPVIMIGALTYSKYAPGNIDSFMDIFQSPQKLAEVPFDSFTTIPLLIFNWAVRPKAEFQHVAAAAILVLLFVLLSMNAVAIYIRYRFQTKIRW